MAPPLAEIRELTSCFSLALNERSIVNDFPVNAPVLCQRQQNRRRLTDYRPAQLDLLAAKVLDELLTG